MDLCFVTGLIGWRQAAAPQSACAVRRETRCARMGASDVDMEKLMKELEALRQENESLKQQGGAEADGPTELGSVTLGQVGEGGRELNWEVVAEETAPRCVPMLGRISELNAAAVKSTPVFKLVETGDPEFLKIFQLEGNWSGKLVGIPRTLQDVSLGSFCVSCPASQVGFQFTDVDPEMFVVATPLESEDEFEEGKFYLWEVVEDGRLDVGYTSEPLDSDTAVPLAIVKFVYFAEPGRTRPKGSSMFAEMSDDFEF